MPVDAERVQAIFWEVVQVSDLAGRVAVLERECPAGGELRQRVEALLKAHDDAGAFLSEPPIVPGAWSPPTRRQAPVSVPGAGRRTEAATGTWTDECSQHGAQGTPGRHAAPHPRTRGATPAPLAVDRVSRTSLDHSTG